MMAGPSSAPSSPPEIPAPTKWKPCSRSAFSRRMVSGKCELPPSTMMSPGSRWGSSESMVASVAGPALTIRIIRRGRFSEATKSAISSAGTKDPSAPCASISSWVRAGVRLYTATV